MMRRTFTKLLVLVLGILGGAICAGVVQSQSESATITLKRVTQFNFRSAVFSPDGKYLATVDDLSRIKVWNAANGQLLYVLALPSGPNDIDPYFGTAAVTFTNDSAKFITQWSGLTKLWGTASGKLIRDVDDVSRLDGQLSRMSSGSEPVNPMPGRSDALIPRILESTSETSWDGETYPAEVAAYSADGRFVATERSSQKKEIEVWSLETSKRIYSISASEGDASASEDSQRFFIQISGLQASAPVDYLASTAAKQAGGDARGPSIGFSAARIAPSFAFLSLCGSRSTIGGRLTRRVDVFGDEVPQYRPVKGEPIFLWDEDGDEVARTRSDRNGGYSFPNLCPGTYTVHPGIASPLLPSRYEPSRRTTTVPAPINQVSSPAHLDFVRKQPPPPRQSEFSSRG